MGQQRIWKAWVLRFKGINNEIAGLKARTVELKEKKKHNCLLLKEGMVVLPGTALTEIQRASAAGCVIQERKLPDKFCKRYLNTKMFWYNNSLKTPWTEEFFLYGDQNGCRAKESQIRSYWKEHNNAFQAREARRSCVLSGATIVPVGAQLTRWPGGQLQPCQLAVAVAWENTWPKDACKRVSLMHWKRGVTDAWYKCRVIHISAERFFELEEQR